MSMRFLIGIVHYSPLPLPFLTEDRLGQIGSCVCSTLLSDLPSPERPCASLLLHLHQVVQGTHNPRAVEKCSAHNQKAEAFPPRLQSKGKVTQKLRNWAEVWLEHLLHIRFADRAYALLHHVSTLEQQERGNAA